MQCNLCGEATAENFGTVDLTICPECIETPAGQEAARGPSVRDMQAAPAADKVAASAASRVAGGFGAMKGLVLGVVIALAATFAFTTLKDFNKESIVKETLAYYNIHVDSVEILQYSTYPTNQGAKLQNFIVQGSKGGYLYRAKVQYMKGREMGKNGVEFQQGSMTYAMGTFYNF